MTNKRFHLIGIGGISMSGIAKLLSFYNYKVTGSNNQENEMTVMLQNMGIDITIGTDIDKVKDSDIIIYTAAIPDNHEELVIAKKLNKKIYSRSEFIGELCKHYDNVISIAGTHGKSTATGMTSLAFLKNGVDPTILIGAHLNEINGNAHIGDTKYLILETCEYKDSFLDFYPTSETILNIDDDHLDYFINMDNIKKSFNKFINIESNKYVVINNDDNIKDLTINVDTLTFGIINKSDLVAKNIVTDELGFPSFDVYYKDELLTHIKLSVRGNHNIYNALATIGQSLIHNLDIEKTKEGLEAYRGVGRRFEYLGKYKNVDVYDDYAHHPTEIYSTVNSVSSLKYNESYAVFQAHMFSRTKDHLMEFADALSKFDNIIIAPIYGARENNDVHVSENDLVDLIKEKNENAIYIDNTNDIVKYLKEHVKDNDVIITVGAGPINVVGLQLVNEKEVN